MRDWTGILGFAALIVVSIIAAVYATNIVTAGAMVCAALFSAAGLYSAVKN